MGDINRMTIANIELPIAQITQFCQSWQISELALFGSVIRDDFRPDSDIDVLVTFHPDAHPTLFDLVDMQEQLETIFARKTDLISRRGIETSQNLDRKQAILSSAITIYDARQTISQ
jgi:uncharacterized protein